MRLPIWTKVANMKLYSWFLRVTDLSLPSSAWGEEKTSALLKEWKRHPKASLLEIFIYHLQNWVQTECPVGWQSAADYSAHENQHHGQRCTCSTTTGLLRLRESEEQNKKRQGLLVPLVTAVGIGNHERSPQESMGVGWGGIYHLEYLLAAAAE